MGDSVKILLLQLDGSCPSIALMRLAAHHRAKGDDVELRQCRSVRAAERGLWDDFDLVFASLIFTKSQPVARRLLDVFPGARVGGTGWDLGKPQHERMTLERLGVGLQQDYTDYPSYPHSIGYTQRGCRLACSFCDVPKAEGKVKPEQGILDLWRGDPWPRNVCLLDNDFFGQPDWRRRIDEIRTGNFRVCFNQGINCRMLNDEAAEAIASVRYSDDDFKERRIYTAWDAREDEETLFRGLRSLVRYGVRADNIMVYILVGYDHRTKQARPFIVEDDLYRQRRLREFGARPYPMIYVRNDELRGFQRWVTRRADLKVSWPEFRAVNCRPERLRVDEQPLFSEVMV